MLGYVPGCPPSGGDWLLPHARGCVMCLSEAKSLPELAKLQADFLQQQLAKAAEQTSEFFDLSTRATQHAFEKFQTAATKSVEQVKPRR